MRYFEKISEAVVKPPQKVSWKAKGILGIGGILGAGYLLNRLSNPLERKWEQPK